MIARYLIGMGIAAAVLMTLATFARLSMQKNIDARPAPFAQTGGH